MEPGYVSARHKDLFEESPSESKESTE